MISIVWRPGVVGVIFLVVGLIAVRREFAAARGLDKLLALGRVLVAAPLAGFGTEHLAFAGLIMQGVPAWMPARLFVAYFVGVALIAAALGLTFKKQMRPAGALLAAMFFGFVVLLHAPNVVAHLGVRVFWTVALRDLVFAAGGLALAGTPEKGESGRGSNRLVMVARLCVAAALLAFSVEEFLFPRFVPGVPLNKMMPGWMPVPAMWGYLCGAILLAGGLCLLVNKNAWKAAAGVGLLMIVLTCALYAPNLAVLRAATGPEVVEGFNYVADTMLFGGMILFLARALEREQRTAA